MIPGIDDKSDYLKLRGMCHEMSRKLCESDPSLTLVRGRYFCPIWGAQDHWWCTKPDGTIVDPTARQFPSKGTGEYVPFDGTVECSQCSKVMKEEDARVEGKYVFCSSKCYGVFVGLLDESTGKLLQHDDY